MGIELEPRTLYLEIGGEATELPGLILAADPMDGHRRPSANAELLN